MKRLYNLLVLATSVIMTVGCTRDFDENNNAKSKLKISISNEESQTRAKMIDNPGLKMTVQWSETDKIGLFGSSSGNNIEYTITKGSITNDGKNAEITTSSSVPTGDLTAYFPYQANAVINSSGGLQLIFPAKQSYSTENGVPVPDDASNFMVGKGTHTSGISFNNLFSVLKIGYSSEGEKIIKEVQFRDLSGKSVSGNFVVNWNGNEPQAVFPDNGGAESLVLAVDCGEGVTVRELNMGVFFLIVPAREYPKGFEITFIASDGSKEVKTIGTKVGKTLARSIVYSIGGAYEIPSFEGVEYKIAANARIMTEEQMEYIAKVERYDYVDNVPNFDSYLPSLEMVVHKDFGAKKGDVLIFNTPSELLPEGMLGTVYETQGDYSSGDYMTLKVRPVTDITDAFEELSIGGAEDSDAVNLNIGQYVSRIVTPDGSDLAFTRNGSQITFNIDVPQTRAVKRNSYSSPTFSTSVSKGPGKLSFKAQVDMEMAMSMSVHKFTLEYLHVNCKPTVNITTEVGLVGEVEFLLINVPLVTVYFTPIPVGPLVLTPFLDFEIFGSLNGEVSVKGEIGFEKSFSCGVSYNKGQGVSTRGEITQPQMTSDLSFQPGWDVSFSAHSGIKAKPGFSLYGLARAGMGISTGLSLVGTGEVSVFPKIEVDGFMYTRGGKIGGNATLGEIEFKPIWSRYTTIPDFSYNIANNLSSRQIEYSLSGEGQTLFDYEIGYALYSGTYVDYDPYEPSPNDPEFDPSPYNSSWDGLLNTSLLGIYHAGTFKKDIAEKQEFKGSIPYAFQEGKAYGILMVYWSKSDQSDLKYKALRGFKDGDTYCTVIFPIRDENGNVVYKRL